MGCDVIALLVLTNEIAVMALIYRGAGVVVILVVVEGIVVVVEGIIVVVEGIIVVVLVVVGATVVVVGILVVVMVGVVVILSVFIEAVGRNENIVACSISDPDIIRSFRVS